MGGYYQGFDTAESAALCLPRVECEHLCTLLGDACWGVDMHDQYPRCFLNGPGCLDQAKDGALNPAEGFGYDTSYTLLQKSTGAPARKLQMAHINWATSARGELVMMPGVSTTYNLRFTDLTFSSSGTFKVCFCDSESATVRATRLLTSSSRSGRFTSPACTASLPCPSCAPRSATSSTTEACRARMRCRWSPRRRLCTQRPTERTRARNGVAP